MKALIIAAHGSRSPAFNEEIQRLAEEIAGMDHAFDRVAAAFLQFGSPSIDEQITALVNAGAGTIVLFPYFIAAGSHVRQDLPGLVRSVAEEHPGLKVHLTSHLGKLPGIGALIVRGISAV